MHVVAPIGFMLSATYTSALTIRGWVATIRAPSSARHRMTIVITKHSSRARKFAALRIIDGIVHNQQAIEKGGSIRHYACAISWRSLRTRARTSRSLANSPPAILRGRKDSATSHSGDGRRYVGRGLMRSRTRKYVEATAAIRKLEMLRRTSRRSRRSSRNSPGRCSQASLLGKVRHIIQPRTATTWWKSLN